jgi:hypothetical protein
VYVIVGFEVLKAVIMKGPIFWDITSCSPLKVNGRFGGTYRLHLQSRNMRQETSVKQVANLQETFFYETSVDFQRNTLRYVPEERTIFYFCLLSLSPLLSLLISFVQCQ